MLIAGSARRVWVPVSGAAVAEQWLGVVRIYAPSRWFRRRASGLSPLRSEPGGGFASAGYQRQCRRLRTVIPQRENPIFMRAGIFGPVSPAPGINVSRK